MNSKRRFCFSTACWMSSSVVCSPGWSRSSWGTAAIAFWPTSSAWIRTLSPVDASNYSIRMYRLTARAVPAADANQSKKNHRHRHADRGDLRQRFQRRGLPIISVDTKKRELVGNFKNPGSRWDRSARRVQDHDFRSDATGVAIPYGIYDLLANRGSVMVGVSHDTSAFAAHAIAYWWRQEGSVRYPRSRQLLILSDTGGSNGARRRAWKTELQSQLADSLGLTLTVAHYPTGASKWNPIEHRLFSEISKNWAGEPLDSYQKILNFIRSTRTETGLSVTAQLDRRNYPTGTEPTPQQLQSLRLKPHEVLPKWNYTISPNL